jgi:hypothetical protein
MTAPTNSRFRRSLRRFTLGRGRLKRRSDRVQLLGRLVVVLSFLAAPPLAVIAATAATSHLETVAAAEAAERHQASAVLLVDAPAEIRPAGSAYGAAVSGAVVAVRATWSSPGQQFREGWVTVHLGTSAGTAVPVWLDTAGNLTGPPLGRDAVAGSAQGMGLLFLIGVPLATWTCYVVLSWALDAYRDVQWARDWDALDRQWGPRPR